MVSEDWLGFLSKGSVLKPWTCLSIDQGVAIAKPVPSPTPVIRYTGCLMLYLFGYEITYPKKYAFLAKSLTS